MRWAVLAGMGALLGAIAVVGCGSPPATCAVDADCGPAARCDTEAKVCIQRKEDTSCSAACLEWEYCSETVCYPRYSGIALLEPSAGTVDGGAVVRAQLQPIAPWISLKQHSGLWYSVTQGGTEANGGPLSPVGDAGVYAGQIAVAVPGDYQLTTGFRGFPQGSPKSPAVAIKVDTTAPTFTVTVPTKSFVHTGGPGQPDDRDPNLSGAFKRNDVVTIGIGSNDTDLDTTSIALRAQLDGGTISTFPAVASSGCGSSLCWDATVDLTTVEMLALRGRMNLTATGRDVAGNEGQGAGSIPVTRFKWSRSLPGVTSVQASPAVGAAGTIYVGTTTGTLSAIQPNGLDQWPTAVNFSGALLASPAVGHGDGGAEIVYANPNINPPFLYAISGADGGLAVAPVPPPTTGTVAASPLIALTRVSISDSRESATTFTNGSPDFSIVSLRFGIPTSSNQRGDGGSVVSPGNVVGEDNIAFVLDNTQRIHEYAFSSNWGVSAPDRVTTGTSLGLALTPTLVAGSTGNSIFAFPRASGTTFSKTESSPSIPSFIGSDLVYSEGSTFTAVRVNPSAGTPITGNLGVATTTPLVATGGITYFVGTDNSIHVLSPNLVTLWSGTPESSVVVTSSPNIDCARATDGTKLSGPGTLYYGANNGKLYAIIVDNPGIDTTSPWPKYQHDPRNTGSLSTPLSEFVCP